jgi:hypothetical protein
MLTALYRPAVLPHCTASLYCLDVLQGGVPMPPWVLDSGLSHATKRQLAFMYDIGVLAPFMLDVACVQQLEKLDDGEAQYALDELGKALSDRVRLRNPSGFFIRICQRLRATRREREVAAAAAPPPAAAVEGGPPAGGPVSFAEREQARERERERERTRLGDGGGGLRPPGDGGGGGFGGTPGPLGAPAGSSPRGGGGFGGPPGMRGPPGRGVRGGVGLDEPEPPGLGDGPPVGFRHRGRSSSRSPPPRRGGPDRPGFWGPGGEAGFSWGLWEAGSLGLRRVQRSTKSCCALLAALVKCWDVSASGMAVSVLFMIFYLLDV